jgi:hypothetical protein
VAVYLRHSHNTNSRSSFAYYSPTWLLVFGSYHQIAKIWSFCLWEIHTTIPSEFTMQALHCILDSQIVFSPQATVFSHQLASCGKHRYYGSIMIVSWCPTAKLIACHVCLDASWAFLVTILPLIRTGHFVSLSLSTTEPTLVPTGLPPVSPPWFASKL